MPFKIVRNDIIHVKADVIVILQIQNQYTQVAQIWQFIRRLELMNCWRNEKKWDVLNEVILQ